ncbi:MAG: hypothetical protein RLZZ244_1053, partial [Verrucomicrobiota bacterium]
RYGFLNWDDIIYIRDYPQVKAGLSWEGFRWAWTHPHYSNWHPLTTLSFMLDATLFKENGAGFHIHNLLLHAATPGLLFLALRQLTGSLWRSAFAAALFAVHPLRVESVVWITERKDVLSGLFLMATLWAYAAYAKAPSLRRFLPVALLFACGLLSKSILVTVPALLLLLDFWPLRRFQPEPHDSLASLWNKARPLFLEKIPLILLSLGSCVATVLSVDLRRPMSPPPFLQRLEYIPVWWMSYVRQFFAPVDLAAHYPYSPSGPSLPVFLGALLLSALLTALCFGLRKRFPMLLMSWLWFLVALLPVIGIVPPGIQIMADRYTYVAHIGFAIAGVWIAANLLRRFQRPWLAPALGLLALGSLTAQSIRQTSIWKDDESLWRHTVAVTSQNDFGNGQLGDSLAVQGRLKEAEPFYLEALRLNPNLAGVLNNLAIVMRSQGKNAEAESYLRRATTVSPWFVGAKMDLSNLLLSQNRLADARDVLVEALKVDPDQCDALYRLGVIHSDANPALKDLPKAVQYLSRAAQLQPGNPQIFFSLGNAHFLAENAEAAIQAMQTALRLEPKHSRAANNLGTIFNRLNRLPESIQAYRMAVAADPAYFDAFDGLAESLFRANAPGEALQAWREILRQKPDDLRALFKIAWVLSTHPDPQIRNGSEAEALARKGIELSQSKEFGLFDALAAALAEQGRFPEAVEASRKSLEMLENVPNPQLKQAVAARLETFRQGKPFRMGS